jgi:Zn finger protein HypA/HybF involved in hydrogenase expression
MFPPPKIQETERTGAWNPVNDVQRYQPESQISRAAFDRNFFRNILFLAGIQWIRYERASLQWKPINIPDWFPRTTTNKFAVAVDTMRSVFEQSNPQVLYGPAGADEKDIAAAEAAKKISAYINREVNNEKLRNELAAWLAVLGNGFVVDGYDLSGENGRKIVPNWACLTCQKEFPATEVAAGCPICNGGNLVQSQNGQEVPIGKMVSEVASPFEMLFDLQAVSLEKSSYVIRVKTYPTETVRAMFPEMAKDIQPCSQDGNMGIYYQRAVAYVTGGSSTYPSYAAISASGHGVDRTTVYHIMKAPSNDLPYGGEAIVISDRTIWKGELSTKRDDGTPFYPITHFKFKNQPGRVYGKSPADDLVTKQIQLNKIDALLQMGMERVTNPCWILPTGIGIAEITGIPGEKIWYNGMLNGLKPERVPGMEMPGSAFRYREIIAADFDDISASYSIMKGETPAGVPTLGGIHALMDRGLARFSDGLKNWGTGWTEVERKRLWIFKQNALDDVVQMVLGENSQWEAQKFNGAMLAGGIDVTLEPSSVQPRSRVYQQMVVGQLLSGGLVDMGDPLIRAKVFGLLDAEDIVQGLNADIKDAIKEREVFLETGQLRPREIIDNHPIHLAQHVKDAKSEMYFSAWTDPQRQAFLEHIAWHRELLEQQQQQAMLQNPEYQKAQIVNQALAEKSKIALDAMFAKKHVELAAMGLKHGLKIGEEAMTVESTGEAATQAAAG